MPSTRVQFHEELENLRHRLLRMSGDVDWMLDNAIKSMIEGDLDLAKRVIRADDSVDKLDLEIETACMSILALQQPVARDLRLVGSALKSIADIERIGDYAVDIAKIGRRITKNGFYKPLVDLPKLTGLVRQMLTDVLSAFVDHDVAMVAQVVDADDAVDDLFHAQRDYLMGLMQQDNTVVYLATNVLFVAKYLERCADHVVNIAERVNYIETGSLTQLVESHQAAAVNGE